MPTTSPGRFQSRLFNFINRRYRRLTDTSDRAIRHIQVATIWGVQALLYPVYVVLQSARLMGQRLQQALGQAAPAPSPSLPPADASIQRVLQVAQSYYLASGPEQAIGEHAQKISHSPSNHPSPVAGIATASGTRNLVLVDNQNQVLDILTQQQQQTLHQEISFEISHSPHQRNLVDPTKEQSSIILSAPEDSTNLFAPARFLGKLMQWVQTPVAAFANLFQEEKQLDDFELRKQELKQRSQELKSKQQELQHKSQKTSPTVPLSTHGEGDKGVLLRITESVVNRSKQVLQRLKHKLSNSSAETQRRLGMQPLLKGAVNYLLGESLPPQDAPAINGYQSMAEDDPWLTAEDVFGNSENGYSNLEKAYQNSPDFWQSSPQSSVNKPAAAKFLLPPKQTVSLGDNIKNFIKRHLKTRQGLISHSQSQSDLVVRVKNPKSIEKVNPNSAKQIAKQSSDAADNIRAVTQAQKTATRTNLAKPDFNRVNQWIETEAKPAGYVKHPLERILEWLDNGMLWLEELILKTWEWLQQLLAGKK